ncbi:MAG: CotH kinase family protein [Lachnospiraceae bacterium]|nr:CotH kinase family protein [Lachnospiraceae bacterium]
MSSQRISIIAVLIISLGILGVILFGDRVTALRIAKPTLALSYEEIDAIPYVRFLLPASENRGLKTDLCSTVFDEDELMQYFIVPRSLDIRHTVCYAVDASDNYLNRYEIDFSEENSCNIGLRHLEPVYTELPVMAIDIDEDSPSFEDLIASDKTVECFGNMRVSVDSELAGKKHWIEEIYSKDTVQDTAGAMRLRGRGNTTWQYSPKKSFTLEMDEAVHMLGLGKHRSFNLISNSQDKTLLNNEVFLDMAKNAGLPYEPGHEQVTLYVNGQYQGVYLLTTKVKADKGCIPLKDGDFLVNWGDPSPEQRVDLVTSLWLDDEQTIKTYANIVWPKEETAEEVVFQQQILQRFLGAVENIEDNSYTDIVDIDSMIRYYWVQEISMNYDADYRSVYSYYKADRDKIFMGPIWDMDLTLGWNAAKGGNSFTEPVGWKVRGLSWYASLFEREEFRQAVSEMYWNGGIREAMLTALEQYEKRMEEMNNDGYLNFRRWRSDWPALWLKYGDSYNEEAEGRLDFFRQRVEWIDSEMSRQ